AMLNRYFDGVVPEPAGQLTPLEEALKDLAARVTSAVGEALERMELNQALIEIWQLIGRGNKYIDETEPWALMREGNRERLATVMYHVFELQRIVALLIHPFMPETAEKIWDRLGIAEPLSEQRLPDTAWGGLRPGVKVTQGDPLFPRIQEDDEEVEEAGADSGGAAASGQAAPGQAASGPAASQPGDGRAQPAKQTAPPQSAAQNASETQPKQLKKGAEAA